MRALTVLLLLTPAAAFSAAITEADGYLLGLRSGFSGFGSLQRSLITQPNGSVQLYNFPTQSGLPSTVTGPGPGPGPGGPSPIPQQFGTVTTATWSSLVSADFGLLKARLSVGTTTPQSTVSVPSTGLGSTWEVGDYLQGEVWASYEDTYTINSPNVSNGALNFVFDITGTETVQTTTPGSTSRSATFCFGHATSNNPDCHNINGNKQIVYSFQAFSGMSLNLKSWFRLAATAGLGSSVNLDYSNTIRLTEIDFVDQNNQSIPFTLQTSSNSANYASALPPSAQEIPEPSTVLSLCAGLALIARLRKRK